MGKYINHIGNKALGASFTDKCNAFENARATKIDTPSQFKEGLICVIDNGHFAAAAHVYSENEMRDFTESFTSGTDNRPRQWYDFPEADKWSA